jgi:hypothetical protein
MLKEYINSKKIGDTIHRQELIQHVYKGPMPKRYSTSYGSTLDNYRKLLTKLGVLQWIDRGEYKLRYYIKNDLTTSQLQLLVTNGIRI